MPFPMHSSLYKRHPPPLSCPVSWQRQALWFGDIQLVAPSEEKSLQSNKSLNTNGSLKAQITDPGALTLSTRPFHLKSTAPHFHCGGFSDFLDLSPLLYSHSEQLAQLLSLRGHPGVWRESLYFSGGWKTKCFPSQVKFILSTCDFPSPCRI